MAGHLKSKVLATITGQQAHNQISQPGIRCTGKECVYVRIPEQANLIIDLAGALGISKTNIRRMASEQTRD